MTDAVVNIVNTVCEKHTSRVCQLNGVEVVQYLYNGKVKSTLAIVDGYIRVYTTTPKIENGVIKSKPDSTMYGVNKQTKQEMIKLVDKYRLNCISAELSGIAYTYDK